MNLLRDYVEFLNGKMKEKPKMVSVFEEDDDFVRSLVPPFDGLLPISQELSNNIYRAGIEIQELDDLRKPTIEGDVLKEVSKTSINVYIYIYYNNLYIYIIINVYILS